MKKEQIEQIQISVDVDDARVLSILMTKNGEICRQGTGHTPCLKLSIMVKSDGCEFNKIMAYLHESVLSKDGVYDHEDKSGVLLNYKIIFLGSEPNIKVFEFILGSETREISDLLPRFGYFIDEAINVTNCFYKNVDI